MISRLIHSLRIRWGASSLGKHGAQTRKDRARQRYQSFHNEMAAKYGRKAIPWAEGRR